MNISKREEESISAEIDCIIDEKQENGIHYYKVHWKKLPASLDEWVKETDINGLEPILAYKRKASKFEQNKNPKSKRTKS